MMRSNRDSAYLGRLLIGTGLGAALAGCAGPAPETALDPDPSVLVEADRAFNRDVAAGGSTAWASWFAEDGAMIQEGAGEIRGRTAVARAGAFLDEPGTSLTWEPERADIARSGDLGWTTGSYVSLSRAADGTERRGTGRYVSIWRRQPDGTWKVVMDLGNPITR